MPATPAERLLALLLTQPAEHWLPLAKIIRAVPNVRWPALVLQNLGKQGLVERRSDHADVYYRASGGPGKAAPPGQRVARGAARALQLAGAVAPVDVAIQDSLEPLTGAQAVAAMTGGGR